MKNGQRRSFLFYQILHLRPTCFWVNFPFKGKKIKPTIYLNCDTKLCKLRLNVSVTSAEGSETRSGVRERPKEFNFKIHFIWGQVNSADPEDLADFTDVREIRDPWNEFLQKSAKSEVRGMNFYKSPRNLRSAE